MLASSVIDKVAGALLNDRNKVRFIQADLLAFFNEACRFIAGINPSAYSTIQAITLVAGARQAVPAAAHSFLGVAYNLGSDGTTPGRAIDTVKRALVDVPDPYWRTRPPKAEIRHIVADDELPTIFDVYPPAIAGTKIAAKLAMIPADVTAGDAMLLEDTYEPAVMNYMLFRAYSKNAEFAANQATATAYYQAVLQFLGMKSQVDPASAAESETREVTA